MKALRIKARAPLLVRLAMFSLALLLSGCGDGDSAPSGANPLDQAAAEALGFAVKPAPAHTAAEFIQQVRRANA